MGVEAMVEAPLAAAVVAAADAVFEVAPSAAVVTESLLAVSSAGPAEK